MREREREREEGDVRIFPRIKEKSSIFTHGANAHPSSPTLKKKKIEFVSQPSCKQSCHEKHNQISNLVVFLPRENLPLVAKLPVDLPLGSQIYKVAFGGGGRGGEGGLKLNVKDSRV